MKNKITDLRDHLFVVIESLMDPDKPLDIERARAVADVAQVMINSAKVELQAAQLANELGVSMGSGFVPAAVQCLPGVPGKNDA